MEQGQGRGCTLLRPPRCQGEQAERRGGRLRKPDRRPIVTCVRDDTSSDGTFDEKSAVKARGGVETSMPRSPSDVKQTREGGNQSWNPSGRISLWMWPRATFGGGPTEILQSPMEIKKEKKKNATKIGKERRESALTYNKIALQQTETTEHVITSIND